MTVEEIYIKLRDELTAENESSSSPERIFIKNDEQTICTLGMNRSHEIIFVEFKPAPKDLHEIEREGFVHPHPVEMLHDAGWRQAQLTTWEESEKLLEIINRSYKKKKPKPEIAGAKKPVKIPLLKNRPATGMSGRAGGSAAKFAQIAAGKLVKPGKGIKPAPAPLPPAKAKAHPTPVLKLTAKLPAKAALKAKTNTAAKAKKKTAAAKAKPKTKAKAAKPKAKKK